MMIIHMPKIVVQVYPSSNSPRENEPPQITRNDCIFVVAFLRGKMVEKTYHSKSVIRYEYFSDVSTLFHSLNYLSFCCQMMQFVICLCFSLPLPPNPDPIVVIAGLPSHKGTFSHWKIQNDTQTTNIFTNFEYLYNNNFYNTNLTL